MLKLGERGMSRPVEIEFAVQLWPEKGEAKEFSVLQMRPMVLARELSELNLDDVAPEQVLCRSGRVLGAGKMEDLYDLVVVDVEVFERKHTREVAEQVAQLNKSLTKEGRHYILIGVGRWGSADPWLGIPVKWDHINGARVIVESGFRDMIVEPSQGSHFFQNLTSLGIGYFTCNPDQEEEEQLDWKWITAQPEYARHTFRETLALRETASSAHERSETAGHHFEGWSRRGMRDTVTQQSDTEQPQIDSPLSARPNLSAWLAIGTTVAVFFASRLLRAEHAQPAWKVAGVTLLACGRTANVPAFCPVAQVR